MNNLADRIFDGLQKKYVVLGATSVRAWHAWLLVGLLAGVAGGIVFVANRSGEVMEGSADTEALQAFPSALRWFGYYHVLDYNYAGEVAPFTNAAYFRAWDVRNITETLNHAAANNLKVILDVGDIFFISDPNKIDNEKPAPGGGYADYDLMPDYVARWTQFISINALDTRQENILAFYISDEPTWNGIPYAELKVATDKLEATFPAIPVILVEAAPILNALQVPPSVDWIGFDHFNVRDPASDGVYQSEYALLKSKRSRLGQKIVVVLDAWWSEAHRNAGLQQAEMGDVAMNYYAFAKRDPSVVLLLGLTWPSEPFLGGDGKGLRDLPQNVIDAHKRIGELITGKNTGIPALSSVVPATVTQGKRALFTFRGVGFENGAVLTASPAIGEIPLRFVSPTLLRLSMKVDMSPGVYNVQVRNPNGAVTNKVSIVVQ